MKPEYSEKLKLLPPYLFIEIDRRKKAAIERGADIISFGVGDPDMPTPRHIVEAGKLSIENPKNHQYPFGSGLMTFREAVSRWYRSRFGVNLNPANQVHSLIGSKEGIGHIHLAFVNPGDVVLIPEPGYPVYNTGALFAGGEPYFMPLVEKNGFLPDFSVIPDAIFQKAKLMFLNYPNNPTAAVADKAFYASAIEIAKKYSIIIAADAAYSEIFYDDPPISFLEVEGAMEVGVEFHSLSKTYNMTGWRLGFAAGNADIIKGLASVKDNYDSGVFQAIQEAGVCALSSSQKCVDDARKIYCRRRDALVSGLIKLGWTLNSPVATFYVWAKVPPRYKSGEAVAKLLDEAAIVATPGNGLGPSGEGYVRFALTVPEPRIKEALERMSKIKW
ncbi:MAG: LL-diaminopimelate aminotransferase [Endomicrobiia bacterium]|nr:LL-diaminopimelate aminotransferase [Endomicrobiia bacterium]